MPHPLQAIAVSIPRVLPQLYAPTAQNDNNHPDSPASAAALRAHRALVTAAHAAGLERRA